MTGLVRDLNSRPAWVGLGAIAAVGLTHLLDYGAFDLKYRLFDANRVESWSHILDAAALAAGTAVCVAGARRTEKRSGARRAWAITATVLALFVLDEASGLHSRIGDLHNGKLLYAPILVVLAYCIWRLTRDGRHVGQVRAAAALLVCAYAIHVLDPHRIARTLGWPHESWAFQVVVALKEGTELAGVLLALLALTAAAAAAAAHGRPLAAPQQASVRTTSSRSRRTLSGR